MQYNNVGQKMSLGFSKIDRLRFALSYFICSLLWMSGLGMIGSVLLPQHLKDIVGRTKATAIFGLINAISAVVSLIANLVFGNLSDRTRSRFGQRTPWIIGGGLVGGISLFLSGVFTNIWAMGIFYCICMLGLNAIVAPVIATMSDRIPKDARATMSAFNSAGITIGTSVGTLLGAHFISVQIP